MTRPLYQQRDFTVDGVEFHRLTPFHESGKYAVVDAEGGKWSVTGDGTNRYPWFIRRAETNLAEGGAKNLEDAARWIARYRRRNPLSPYKRTDDRKTD